MARSRLVGPQGGLLEWTLATFHASAFVLLVVFFLYTRDALGPALGGLNTLLGLALFVVLWATTYLTTCRAVEGLDLVSEGDRALFVRRAFRWGAANGMAFLGVLALVLVGSAVFVSPNALLPVLFVGPFALIISAVVGALIGLLFSAIDLALLALARALAEV